MKRIKLFEEFIKEAVDQDLYKIYLCIDPQSNQKWWTNKGFAGEEFFTQLSFDNYKDVDIDPSYPVLNYSSKICKHLLDKGLIKDENVYNHPKYIKLSGSKSEFHKKVEGDVNIPTTCYNKADALKQIGFPMIAKPTKGHSGIGIQIFKTDAEFEKADHSKLDVYSQYVDKKSEHRIINFKGKPIFWMQREPMNDKAKTGKGSGDEEMEFKYIKRNCNTLPGKFTKLIEKYCNMFKELPYITFDIMEDQGGKLYVIESNSQAGVPYDSAVHIYRNIFKDFYGRDVNDKATAKLADLSDFMNQKTLDSNPERFEIKD
jgi:hypothetical protein